VRIKVGRIFNTYGPRMSADDGRVVSNFIVQALAEKPLTMYGNGEQTRSFCYVSDLIDAIVALMKTDDEIIGPINLGNPHEFTVMELAQKVKAYTQSSSPILQYPLPADDPRKRQPDITPAHRILSWAPKISLDEGLIYTINDFKMRSYPHEISHLPKDEPSITH